MLLPTIVYRVPRIILLFYLATPSLTRELAESEAEEITTWIETSSQMSTLGTSPVTDVNSDLCVSPCLSDGLSLAVGVVPVLCIVFLLVVVGVSWYMTSYKKVLKDWTKLGRDGGDGKDPVSGIGLDGRAVWEGLYGPYEAQEAMDMINIFMLAHHRLGKRKLPIYAIRGKELASIEHAFSHLPADRRPWFTPPEKIMAGDNGRDDDSYNDASVMSVSSNSSIVPLHRVEGSTRIADIAPKFGDAEPSGSSIPVLSNIHGNQAFGIEPLDLTLAGKGELSPFGSLPCLGKVPFRVQTAILPVCGKEQEFVTRDNMV